jgi:peptide/nickel transport system permease protein
MSAVVSQPDAPQRAPGARPLGLQRPGRRSPLWLVGKRLLAGVVILLLISVVVFAATQLIPSDPARSILGPGASEAQLQSLRHRLGLDRPALTQYLSWLGGAVRGHFGNSLVSQRPVSQVLGDPTRNTAILVLIVTALSVLISIVAGVVAAQRRDSIGDHAFVVGAILVSAVPSFVIGIILTLLFATSVFHILPAVSLLGPGELPLEQPKAMVLPGLALMCTSVPYLARLVRASMIDALNSEYVQMARMKGVPERRILFRHALPNAIVPMVQGTALTMSWLAGGTVAVEFLFNYPGLGSQLSTAVQSNDIPVVQAAVLILAGAVVLFNLIADVLTIYLTPRLRVG